ncbi:MAG: HNH endonuclease [Anaerolineae bacterium]|nr:HNH endonuclease [Anaerolineae bacterium]
MSRSYISKQLRERIAAQARYRCGYCLTQEKVIGMPMEIDHIIPEAQAGETVEDNLWLACSLCNAYKGEQTYAFDPISNEIVPLFNPRTQHWHDHFGWNQMGDEMIGRTATGRATVVALRLNRELLVEARRGWVAAGWHPPQD